MQVMFQAPWILVRADAHLTKAWPCSALSLDIPGQEEPSELNGDHGPAAMSDHNACGDG